MFFCTDKYGREVEPPIDQPEYLSDEELEELQAVKDYWYDMLDDERCGR